MKSHNMKHLAHAFGNHDVDMKGIAEGSDGQNGEGTNTDYTEAQIADLLYMIEEEKLAGDVYEVLYAQTDMQIFDNIATSEDSHVDAVLTQAEVIGVDVDEILLMDPGTFVNEELQDLYDWLIDYGSTSDEAALEVGVIIEEKDMIDIAAAALAVAGTPLEDVYLNLLAGSVNHLDAFEGQLIA